jgi:hypothetical protein
MRLVVDREQEAITGLHIQRICNVSATHVTALIRRKLLVPLSGWRTGPGGSPRILISSFLEFLESRRFP